MSLSNVTKNWIKNPYPMDLEELKGIALKESMKVIDQMESGAEIAYFLGQLQCAESGVLRDRRGRQHLAAIEARKFKGGSAS